MPHWEERPTRASDPLLVTEHVARYRFAAPAIRDAELWVDIGCGTGVAAVEALGRELPPRVLLVDVDEGALGIAERELDAAQTVALRADAATEEGVNAIGDGVRGANEAAICVTCFETLEHLDGFSRLVSLLVQLAEEGATVVLSVPNEAQSGVEDPYHLTTWGDGAFEELRSALPRDHVAARQVPLQGTAVIPDGSHPAAFETAVEVPAARVPSQFIAAFGPKARALAGLASIAAVDLDGRRAWERQREANLAWAEQRVEDLENALSETAQPKRHLREVR